MLRSTLLTYSLAIGLPVKPENSTFQERSKLAYALHLKGRFREAIAMQMKVVNEVRGGKAETQLDAMKRLALYLFMDKDFSRCADTLEKAVEVDGRDPEVTGNLGVALSRCQRYREAVPWLEKARATEPTNVNWLDGLAHCHGRLGNNQAASRAGEASLQMKAQSVEAAARHIVPPTFPPLVAFDPSKPDENVIAFSLWGERPRYIEGALRNARLAPDLYPGWICRFYSDDTVPKPVLDTLRGYGAQIVVRPPRKRFYEGLLWRFEVINDPTIRRFLIRDADSLLGAREKAAVDSWLCSDRHFHAMRDFYTHTELILAGMWGGVGGILPSLGTMLALHRSKQAPTHTYDQWLLRTAVWPLVRASLLIHDSWFRLPNTEPFPPNAWRAVGTHVGQNFFVTHRARKEPAVWNGSARQQTEQ